MLSRQEGSSFELSTLLVSLLIGVGYDAYCVSGYAVREVTEVDQGGKTCPLLVEREKVRARRIDANTKYCRHY